LGPADAHYEPVLAESRDPFGHVAFRGQAAAEKNTELLFSVDEVFLWRPDTPYLYELTVTLSDTEKQLDTRVIKTGFKEFKASGKRLLRNGDPFFLIGVCRHDLFGDQGHVMTEEQMRTDMRMIKEAGVNYVRLVHYQHHEKILEIADETGLLVSEEPGLWWSDVREKEIFEGSLEVLKRTVRRDRNHVSVGCWLSFNECFFTEEYLRAAAQVCRAEDPGRMVSGANCMDIPMTKKYFTECGFDFYTMHPYGAGWDRMEESAAQLNDKPLVFTEWGGYYVYDNPHLMREFIGKLTSMWRNPDDDLVVAGAALWCWAEVFEFNRYIPACRDGVLREGLVDRYRNPGMCLPVFREAYREGMKEPRDKRSLEIIGLQVPEGHYSPIPLSNGLEAEGQKAAWERMIEQAQKPIERFVFNERRLRVLKYGPVLPDEVKMLGELPVELTERPLVIDVHTPFSLNISSDADCLYLIGNVSMPSGFPIYGGYGEEMGILGVEYRDGEREEIPLRNGIEVCSACAWYGPSRINPRASEAPRVIYFINHMDREHYVVNCLCAETKTGKKVKRISLQVTKAEYNLLLYGITMRE
ncbi:MAG: hypothetical protein LUE87_00905, partial [Lachnospiraceae bacterium]|nr:hypothetical protein [Lachnospiraceae bacterium]